METAHLLTVRAVTRHAHGGGNGDPVIVYGLVGSNDDTVALPRKYIDVIGQRLIVDPVYLNDLPPSLSAVA